MQKDIRELVKEWTNRSFLLNSGFYAGRKPSPGDLGYDHLTKLYEGLKRDVGQDAATNFVRFVNNLGDMSASAFIVAFEKFWGSGCTATVIEQHVGDRARLDARGDALLAQGFGAIMTALGDRTTSEEYESLSYGVKSRFLREHIDEVPTEERRSAPAGIHRMF